MPTYVQLLTWTEQGVKDVKDTVKRLHQARPLLEQRGVKITSALWTQGRYDVVLTVEAPDEESAVAAVLSSASQGFFKTETLRAFTESEMERIIQKMG